MAISTNTCKSTKLILQSGSRNLRKQWDNSVAGAGVPAAADVARTLAPSTFPSQLKIGTVEITPATVLAPMAGVTDTVFRRFIRNLGGCGLIMTEFTSADGVLRAKDKKAKRCRRGGGGGRPGAARRGGGGPRGV